jgi:hypothetical protein
MADLSNMGFDAGQRPLEGAAWQQRVLKPTRGEANHDVDIAVTASSVKIDVYHGKEKVKDSS